ncbi:MAG TPA: serine/threonine protein kinase [Xenococcaceae cyanobacterium]|jgi:hypothetical protein
MSIKFTKFGSILLITAISSFLAVQVHGETPAETEMIQPLDTAEVFEEAFFDHTGDAFENDSIIGQLNTILGFNLFPEKQIALDAELVHLLYSDVLAKQAESGAPLLTRDLENPYNTSLLENPEYVGY